MIKCHIVSRLAEDERWDRDVILEMKGLQWEFAPGKAKQHIPTSIHEDGRCNDYEEDDLPYGQPMDNETETERPYKRKIQTIVMRHRWRKEDLEQQTDAQFAEQYKEEAMALARFNHAKTCRERIIELMKDDPEYKHVANKSETEHDNGEVECLTQEDSAIIVAD